jgi:hypothetical protein
MKRLSLEAVVAEMHKAGCSPEQVGAVVLALQVKPPKSAAAIRQARYRDRKAGKSVTKSVTVTPNVTRNKRHNVTHNVTPNVTPLARVEDNPSTIELSGKGKNNLGAKASRTPRETLLECLSPDIADGVLAHRKAMRRPLTGRAAQLLVKGFLATADPNAAADMMIARGWQGFKPEWFDNERRSNGQQQGQGQSKRGSVSDVAAGFIERVDRFFAHDRPSDRGAEGGPTVRLLPPQRRE